MNADQIIQAFFSRKGGIQWVEATGPGGVKMICSQVIYITFKQAYWLQGVGNPQSVAGKHGHFRGEEEGYTYLLGFPHKNSRQQAANLQLYK